MFIKNQTFSDEDMLLEVLFDFELGTPAPAVQELQAAIEKELEGHAEYQALRASMTDEEDRLELEDEERRLRLAEALQRRFSAFKVQQQRLYGLKGDSETLLWEIDLV